MVPSRKLLAIILVEVTYKCDAYAQVINNIVAYNNDNKVRGNNKLNIIVLELFNMFHY